MDDPQIIRTPSGDEMVLLSREDYDSLLLALADVEDKLAVRVLREAELTRGVSAPLHSDMVATVADGHSRLAAARKMRGLRPEDLAGESGVDVGIINSVENGYTDLTPDQAAKLATALGIPPSWIA